MRRLAAARPLSRVATHLVVVGLVAFSAAFGIAAASAQTEGFAADQPFFSLVGTVRAGGVAETRQPDLTIVVDPAEVDLQQKLERSATAFIPSEAPIPTPLAEPVAPPSATPEPAAGTRQGTGSVAARAPAAPAPAPSNNGTLTWPVPGGVITQYFHAGHLALDIAAPAGSTVIASAPGTVTWAGWRNNGGGLVVQVDHGNGIQTVYNHLGSIWVSPGQWVGRGQGIAGVGCTGICTGPHTHFEVYVNGVVVNPLRYL